MSSFKVIVLCVSLALTGCGSVLDDVPDPRKQAIAPAPTSASSDADAGLPPKPGSDAASSPDVAADTSPADGIVVDSVIVTESGHADADVDSAETDGAVSDTSPAETGAEAGPADAGPTDSGSVDSGPTDSSLADTGTTDVGADTMGTVTPGPFPGPGLSATLFSFTKCEDVPPGNLVVIMKTPLPRWPGVEGIIGFRYLAKSAAATPYTGWVKPTCLASSMSVDMVACCFGHMPKGATLEFINGVVSALSDVEFKEWFTTIFGGFSVRGVSYDVCWSPTAPTVKIGGYTPSGGFTGALSRAPGVTANLLVTMPPS